MTISIQNRQRTIALDTVTLKRHMQQAMVYLGCADRELSLVLASNRLLQKLNRTYRNQNRPTNVLAFPQEPVAGHETATPLLGDVVVSLPIAQQEARELQQSLEDRVLYLLLHGLLHLLGYDHERSPADRRRMHRRERALLAYLAAYSVAGDRSEHRT